MVEEKGKEYTLSEHPLEIKEDFKICLNCGKKFTFEEYLKEHKDERNKKRIIQWWKSRKYCSYDCSTEFYNKTWAERNLTEIKQSQMKFTAPIEIWKVEKGEPTQIKVLLYGEWKVCQILKT